MSKSKWAYCSVSISPVRSEAADPSEIVSQLLFGELFEVEEINAPWARIRILNDGYEGYIDHKHLRPLREKEFKRWSEGLDYQQAREQEIQTPWGKQRICRGSCLPGGQRKFNIGDDQFALLGSEYDHFEDPVAMAKDYLNTPYLWGGKSPFGIDCSGIVQIIYRCFGKNLPRDASEQVDYGNDVEFEDRAAGDLAYFTNSKGKVTHVGILSDRDHIIHAAGHVREDYFTEAGIIHSEHGGYTHPLHCVKRV